MRRLLSANLARLGKNHLFWLSLSALFALSVISMLNGCRQAAENAEEVRYLEDYFFNLVPILGVFFSAFISLFLGTEYSDGTIRNKVVVGHKRSHIYLANLLTCAAASMLHVLAWLIGGLVGIPSLGLWHMSALQLCCYLMITLLISFALSAIFTFLSMVSSGKAVTAVVSLLLFLALLVCGSIIYNRLCEPELQGGIMITAEGMQKTEPTPNPAYLGGGIRSVYEMILNILPTGQAILLANLEVVKPVFHMIASVVSALTVSVLGILIFQKKDQK
ncbi:MAG: ABC transporter permease subunit [Lachnospiraceae bacterium]|nr:ABC transporter permease subunit [Lachnospiraceae bacterium]